MNNKVKTLTLFLFLNTYNFSFSMHAGMPGAAEAATFAQKATKYIMSSEYKKLAIHGGIFLTTTLVSGVGLRAAIDLYKSTKDTVHRTVWGPTQEDKIIAMELEKTKQLTLEKQQALKIGNIKLEQANLDYYTSIMEKRIARAKTPEEKDTLSQTCDETLSQLAEIVKRRISAGPVAAARS